MPSQMVYAERDGVSPVGDVPAPGPGRRMPAGWTPIPVPGAHVVDVRCEMTSYDGRAAEAEAADPGRTQLSPIWEAPRPWSTATAPPGNGSPISGWHEP